jgi:ribosomal peptide maturation radical SAM protein 1
MYENQKNREKRKSTLFVELPFKSVTKPNLAFSLLHASLSEAGYPSEIWYASHPFAAQIGLELYRIIAEVLPQEFLFGDIIFSTALHDKKPNYSLLRGKKGKRDLNRGRCVPEWLWERLPELCTEAIKYINELTDRILKTPTNVIALNSVFQGIPPLALARMIKRKDNTRKIVLGGANCEGPMGIAIHELFPEIDFICRGEGEEFIVELLQSLSYGAPPLDEIEGLIWRKEGSTEFNGDFSRRIRDMDRLPIPDYSSWLEQIHSSFSFLSDDELILLVETSRGCWYGQKHQCTFCGLNGDSLEFRAKSTKRVLDEFSTLSSYGISNIQATDLIMPYQYFRTLLPKITQQNNGVNIFYEVKANLSKEQLILLHNAGIDRIQPGIESLSTPMLKLMKKGVKAFQNVRLLKWCAELGINVLWNILYGFPGEKIEWYQMMADLVALLTHLRPPIDGCCELRLDRFSPLYSNAEHFGVENITPAHSYQIAYGLSKPYIERIAYHFDFSSNRLPRDRSYVEPLRQAVAMWHELVGSSSFVAVDDGNCIQLFDRRPCRIVDLGKLRGLERRIYLMCTDGVSSTELAQKLNISVNFVEDIIEVWAKKKWVVILDNHCLSLAVSLRESIIHSVAPEILPNVVHTVHCSRMKAMCMSSQEQLIDPNKVK